MKPLIKWPGGKTSELKWIKTYLPSNINTDEFVYVEPFFGGGALYFDLLPSQAYLNDLDKDLINFYNAIKSQNKEFFEKIANILHDWNYTAELTKKHFQKYLKYFNKLEGNGNNIPSSIPITYGLEISKSFDYSKFALFNGYQDATMVIFKKFISDSISRKLKLALKTEIKYHTKFDIKNHNDYFETAIKSAYYTLIRYLYNEQISKNIQNIDRTAYFYFIREFCFGSMFRFNSKKLYNIPYGGINYNKKNFERKINNLKNLILIESLQNSEIYNLDFYTFLENLVDRLDENSLVFLDPPYDSQFSDYSKNTFEKEDHIRLKKVISRLQTRKIPFLLIIKETKFIRNLYPVSEFEINSFDKQYTYNMRGRNKRATSHLLISNKFNV